MCLKPLPLSRCLISLSPPRVHPPIHRTSCQTYNFRIILPMCDIVRRMSSLGSCIPFLPLSSRNTKIPFESVHSPRRCTTSGNRSTDDGLRFHAPYAADVTQPLRWGWLRGDACSIWRARECTAAPRRSRIVSSLAVRLRSRRDRLGPECARDSGLRTLVP